MRSRAYPRLVATAIAPLAFPVAAGIGAAPVAAASDGVVPGTAVTQVGWEQAALGLDRKTAQAGVRGRALLHAVVATLLAVFGPRGHRRAWRATVAPPAPAEPEPAEASPPIPLVDESSGSGP